jgi:hypothetical protein
LVNASARVQTKWLDFKPSESILPLDERALYYFIPQLVLSHFYSTSLMEWTFAKKL